MFQFKRTDRLGELILAEIADLLLRGIKDPRIGFATLTRVEVTDDLRYAKVFVSILGEEKEKKRTMAGLKSASGFIRGQLGKRLRLRYTPELTFKLDESIAYSAHIADLLRSLDNQKKDQEE
ncbi:MAG: 30S ribosome-binding factor RbfA [Candidatus Tectomicrobia bacterium]|nr:30S ribosome-binding factor RbfA [Candidatus Tectomicrobia bacterium]